MYKKIISAALSALLVTGTAACFSGCESSGGNTFKTADKVQDGAILQAFSWDFNTIKASLPDIAAAGFSAVQTSPINECLEGEDGGSDDPRAFTAQKPWKRLLILCAGSFNNFLLGLIIIFCLYLGVSSFASATIAGFQKDCPYERADGLQVGDRFLSIDGLRACRRAAGRRPLPLHRRASRPPVL